MLDSSGSVGASDWSLMTNTIADKWLPLLDPVYGENGVHVASRWFSSDTERFIDFQQKSFTSSGNVQLEIFTLKIIYFENIKNFLRQNPEPIVRIYGLYSISSIFDEKY